MGSRKRRRERDTSGRKHRRRSNSRSSSESRSRSRSPNVAVPPPPLISTRDRHDRDKDRERDRERNVRERDNNIREREREREARHRQTRRRHEKSPTGSKRSSNRRSSSKHGAESDSSDCVEVPLPPPAPVISKNDKSSSPDADKGAGDCLSIAETNKLRAKLGLKPLEMDSNDTTSSSSKPKKDAEGNQMHKDEWGEFYHKPASNLSEKLQAEKLREKFRQNKEKRALDEKLRRHKTLGESDEDDDITHWVDKNREKEKLKADAQRRAKILQEMDDEFGVGELVREDTRRERKKMYSSNSLKGLRVEHDVDQFSEGKTVILTLKDQDVLDEENGDTLVNVNMIDDERYRKNIDNKKLNPNQYGYNVYDEEVDDFGNPIQRDILTKYDEELGGPKKSTFVLGSSVEQEIAQRKKLLEIKAKLSGKRLETLDEPLISLASDTYTESELATFKKPKKKKIKKLRQKLKAEDLESFADDADTSKDHRKRDPKRHLSDVLDTDDVDEMPTMTDIKIEEEDNELEHILSKARRLKQSEAVRTLSLDVNKIKSEIKPEHDSDDDESTVNKSENDFITLNATAEFCRTLGDIPTYGMSGNRGVDVTEMMDLENEPEEEEEQMEEEEITGKWSSVDPDLEQQPSKKQLEVTEVAILDEEPDVSSGMGAALKLALSKGYLEKEEIKRPSSTRMAYLQAQNYSIDDKAHGEDEKFNRRDRFHSGPTNDFKEKDNYKPNVKLEYIDDGGRLLNEKEAFRYLSHKFHGKGPGKNKIEKRLKKSEQDGLMMKMSSTDTPLGTLTMLQHKQKETHSPYIVLSGSKQLQGSTSITKHK